MRGLLVLLALVATLGTPATAQDDAAALFLGADAFRAGQSVSHTREGAADLFMAGETVTVGSDVSGTAHLGGRWVTLEGAADGVYAIGVDVRLDGDVAGNATLMGQEVIAAGPIGGNLRAFGSEVALDGDVGGYALIAGEHVTLRGSVAGDMLLTARTLEVGPDATVGGTLRLYEDEPGTLEVPESLVPADRLERHEIAEWDDDIAPIRPFSLWGWLWSFLLGVLVVTLAAALVAVLAPETMAAMRRRLLAAPGRALLIGFVALSALTGAGILLALTIIGLLLTPAAIVLALLAGFFGYVIAAYAFGVWLLKLSGRDEPRDSGGRALAAGTGALVAALIGLIPFLGWLFILGLTMAGAGAIAIRLFRPRFFATY